MSGRDVNGESVFSRWMFDALTGAFVVFLVAMGSAIVYGFWQWILSPATPRCY